MPRGRPRRATRAKIVDIPSSDEEMEVEEEDPIVDVDEPEIAVEPEEEDEEDEESDDKEDELDEDDEQVRASGYVTPWCPELNAELNTRARTWTFSPRHRPRLLHPVLACLRGCESN